MVNKSLRSLVMLFGIFMVCSCGPTSFESQKELLTYLVNVDNGYHFQKSVNGIKYSLTYRPTDLLVAQSLGDERHVEEINNLRKKYTDYLYFKLSISSNGKELLSHNVKNRAEFGASVYLLSFGMEEKAHLISQKRDTLPLLDSAYPRTYGMGTSTDILLIYERDSKILQQDYLLLTLKDLGFNTGEVTFKIATKKIKQQPQINF